MVKLNTFIFQKFKVSEENIERFQPRLLTCFNSIDEVGYEQNKSIFFKILMEFYFVIILVLENPEVNGD